MWWCSKFRMQLLLMSLVIILGFVGLMWLGRIDSTQGRLAEWLIVVDPGHGGVDGGTQDSRGNLEKDVNLAIALRLAKQLEGSGFRVTMTRSGDVALEPFSPGRFGRHRRDLQKRLAKAIESHSLYLISVHCDWSVDQGKHGPAVFYNYQSAGSQALAAAIQTELNRVQGLSTRAAPGKYYILRQRGVTAVLVEAGLLSNGEEAGKLQDGVYQDKLALAITQGVLQAFQGNYSGK